MMRIIHSTANLFISLLIGLPGPLAAADLDLPTSARVTLKDVSVMAQYDVPTGPWHDGAVPSLKVQGSVTRQVWQSQQSGKNALQVLDELRKQLFKQGYSVLFECHDRVCGGFDFRFGIEVLPGPDMYVDLSNYQFLSATRTNLAGKDTYLTLLVSQSAQHDFVQSIHLAGDQAETFKSMTKTVPNNMIPQAFDDLFDQTGSVILSDLVFKSGSSALTETAFASLKKLAAYLSRHPERKIVLVGHTDNIGELARNMALSKQRAQAVAAHLTQHYGIDRDQVISEGTGYLSPIASNQSPEGRKANRRVEAVLLSHQ